MTTTRVAALFVHPIKSAAAIPVESITLDERGAQGDRRWMLIDGAGVAITARTQPALALIRPSFAGWDRNGALVLAAPGLEDCAIAIEHAAPLREVTVWEDIVPAHDAGNIAAEWCSDALGVACRLVRLADHARRPLRAKYAGMLPYETRHVTLSDGAPLLLLGVGSVDALNTRLREQGGEAVEVARFRPNILIDGARAHEEDTWSEVQIGDVRIGVGTPCPRCVMTTVDPRTGEGGVEPLRTLAEYRRDATGVVFGMNATHAAPGVIPVGDTIEVTALR